MEGPAGTSHGERSPGVVWPFDGRLDDLLERPGVVATETYPAAMYGHLRLGISTKSKRRQPDRAADASTMQDWARDYDVLLAQQLQEEIED